MRYVLLVCVLALALTCDLSILIATSDDSLESFDLHYPATLLPIMADHLQTLQTQVGEYVDDLVEWVVTPYCERIRHENSMPPPEP